MHIICFVASMLMVVLMVAMLIIIPAMLISHWFNSHDGANNLSFKDFINFYNVNPDRWDLYDGFVVYKHVYDYYYTKKTYFNFNLFDWIRYRRWATNKEKRDAKIKQDKEMIDFLHSVNADIEKLINESNANAAKAVQDIYSISKRI